MTKKYQGARESRCVRTSRVSIFKINLPPSFYLLRFPHHLYTTSMAEPSYVNTPSSEIDEPVQQDTPNRKALRKAAKVLRETLPRRELFTRYGVSRSADYRILEAEYSHRNRTNSGRKSKLSIKQITEIIESSFLASQEITPTTSFTQTTERASKKPRNQRATGH